MPVFTYTGRAAGQRKVEGELEARDKGEVVAKLRTRHIVVSEVRAKPKEIKLPSRARVTTKDLAIFARLFSTMVNAGLPIDQCLDILASQVSNRGFRKVISEVHQSVSGGASLAEALAKQKRVFDNLFVHMVEAGEAGGALAMIFGRLALYLEKINALKRKVKGAMIYPAVVLTVAVGATIFLLVKVIPVFANMFAQMDATLPAPTLFVIGLSHLVQKALLPGFVMTIVFAFLLRRFYRTENGKYLVDKTMLKVPVIGMVIRKTAVARFTRTLGVLISSGVPILQGLDITAKTAGNAIIQRAIERTRRSISEGKTITVPLRESGVFPPMVVQLISVGEQTGGLAEMLGKIADFYDEEVDAAVAAMTSLIEPVVIVLMGGLIGGMLIAMYLPMFDLVGAIK
ncbi:MAG: type II secretion system F family protein [Calditrichaeota bacterium]|nr:type II secretion system F family protein [Calditrichota bacterium]